MANLRKQADVAHSRTPVALNATASLADRLVARAERTPTGCLEWTGSRDRFGYGWIHFDGRTIKTHRASFAAFVRPLEPGETVCHQCDNPPCMEPTHLFIGTHLDNMRDMASKGRRRPDIGYIKGESHHQAKLTEVDVRRLRAMRETGATYTVLVAEFGISKATVGDICNRKLWKHLT